MEPIHFSVIVPWKGGNPVREKSLQNMINCLSVQETPASLEPIVYELIIVEQAELMDNLGSLRYSVIPSLSVPYKHIRLSSKDSFNKSWCMNVGARQAIYPHLLFMDADSLFGKDFFRTIKRYIRETPAPHNNIMFCWNYIIALIGKDNPIARHIRPDMTMAMGGIWYAKKDFYFNEFGGMNENYFGYGGEDNDAYERACFAMKVPAVSYMPYPLAHQYHDWEPQSNRAINYFDITRKYPQEIINRLKSIGVGNSDHPSLINVEDLKV